ncbi:hypothetical protein L249_0548 [Ophiocordyceps polyrhachis-furcata BCC 54312]|uniref:RNA helicase n=1 Tax=Ophiocordyceps polyrhachis-furcata BCC 54312 TaxID=1330021 RepID=A0A367LEG7_9HYPO|nr:hypothetical protein L249_0548 [Ophiocordyceps polyrhachis-furcata BCC 54312]
MGATKHSLAESTAVQSRPSKKTKIEDDETPQKEVKKTKKSKDKKKKKGKAEEKQPQDNEDGDDDTEAERKAAKRARKAERKREKAKEEEEADESQHAPDKKSKKKNKAGAKGRRYEQTMSLSSLPQSDIDAFLATQYIAVADPRQSDSPLRPVTEFHHLPSTNLLEKQPSPLAGFTAPTPIQAAAWPYALSGRDVVGVAETGSGKTLAFALPCIESISPPCSSSSSSSSGATTKAVVVSPTRELAMQTHAQLARLADLVGLGCVCLYGGASKDDQRAKLKRGCDIIVATPGRLKDLMADGDVHLDNVRFVVLDEADRMLDRGFEDDIKHIIGCCPPREKRQTLMFTATWPQSVQALASTFTVDPVRITVGASASAVGASSSANEGGTVELQANARINQRVLVVDWKEKEGLLLQTIRKHQQGKHKNDRILVFCLYKKEATRVENTLSRKGVRVVGIHGDLRQEQRTRSLEAFKSGETPVLVATDVAARGLDIPEVKLVINVTFPLTIEDYVHRIGRTGRAGNSGEAITFFTVQDKAHSGSLINVLKGANQPVPEELLKFGTTVKKKTHDMYGSFFKDVDMTQKATKITFD